jgi:putative FmdB family regulatory protein
MPLYDYDCAECGRRVEVIHGVHAPGPTHCPNCGGGPLKKAISAPTVHFKGSGWAKKERRATVAAGAAKSSDTSSTGEGEGKSTDGQGKDDAGSSVGGSADKARDDGGDSQRGGDIQRSSVSERTAASSSTAGAGTATKTD